MKKMFFAGGGTLGPVTPLIAVWRQMKRLRPGLEAIWVGTPTGPERSVVEAEGLPFYTLPIAKLPRYLGWELIQFPWNYWRASRTARELVQAHQPNLIVSVGGYMGTPLIHAAAKKGISCAIHQLDAVPGLSNRAVARLCASVTTSFAYPISPFRGIAAVQAPTPCRFSGAYTPRPPGARLRVFILGGGTGAVGLNQLVQQAKRELVKEFDIVHLAGLEKGRGLQEPGYVQAEFFHEADMLRAYQEADIVVARAGLGTISECAALHKATILVPMPHSHQEANVAILGDAVLSVSQDAADAAGQLKKTLARFKDEEVRRAYGERLHQALPTDSGEALAKRWLDLL